MNLLGCLWHQKIEVPYVSLNYREIDFAKMRPSQVDPRVFPRCLSMLCRFNGFVKFFYSVAQHSVMACEFAEQEFGRGSEEARCSLFHDADESYLGDVIYPTKKKLADYRRIEKHVNGCIVDALGLSRDPQVWKHVKRFDTVAVNLEARHILLQQDSWIKPVAERFHEVPAARALIRGKVWYPPKAEAMMWAKMREYGIDPRRKPRAHR